MHGMLPADAQRAMFPAAELRKETAEFRSDCDGWFGEMARKLWASKPGATIRFLTGHKAERQCYAWASGESEPNASILATLLRSDEGARVLDHIMRGSRADWWRDYRRALGLAAAAAAFHHTVEQIELSLD